MYIVALSILLFVYFLIIGLMHKFTNVKLTNVLFFLFTFIPYIFLVLYVLKISGLHDWNFLNTLPTANVSPFMFAISPLCIILPKKIRGYLCNLISLLSVGMFVSPIISAIYYVSIGYAFHAHFLLDYVAHLSLSLWGLYFVYSKQVSLEIKKSLISGSIIVGVAIVMMILNIIFDTSFFGLSLNGKHNIYNVVLVSNSYVSALLYFSGLIVVLIVGYLYSLGIYKLKKKAN